MLKNMKYIKNIIGLLLVFILTSNASLPTSYAATEPEIACTKKKELLDKAYLMESWNEADPQDQNAYEEALEEMQMAYHDYIGCIFDFAERVILQSDGAEDSGTMAANTLNTGAIPIVGGLVDWMTPDQACLSKDKLKEVIQKSEPSQMLQPILDAHKDYKDHLNKLGNEFDNEGIPGG